MAFVQRIAGAAIHALLALRRLPNLKGETMKKKLSILLLTLLAAGCAGTGGRFDPDVVEKRDTGSAANRVVGETHVPPMDPQRKVSEQYCGKALDGSDGNLMCKAYDPEAERRRQQEEERQRKLAAERRAKIEAEERAARERLERQRAEQLALEEAAGKARAAEEERLAAERRRLEDERKAREERARQEREAAEARARQRAEQEAREAAERERLRLAKEWLEGRALLARFVTTYGKVEDFKEVAGQINTFLDMPR